MVDDGYYGIFGTVMNLPCGGNENERTMIAAAAMRQRT
jgi:hypothetical protein